MGMKLKSGADLCGFELSRFCVQNDVAIPDAPASGRKYFHTGTGTEGKYSLLGRERIFTGAAWRSAAYVDDLANLDLATNADYLKLKEKVDLLSGEVDTDAIINNMKEVTAFLEGFAEDANLMSVLDGKLDKTGGEIISEAFGALTINRNLPYASGIKFSNSDGVLGYIGINNDYTPMVWDKDGANAHTLLHSGNVGDYKAGGLAKSVTIWGQSFDGTGNVSGALSLGNNSIQGGTSVDLLNYDHSNTLYLGYGMNGVGGSVICGNAIAMRYGSSRDMGFLLNSSGNVTIGASDLAGTSAKLLVDGDVALRLDVYGGSGNVVYRSLSFLGSVEKRGGLIRCGINDVYSDFHSLEFGSYANPTMMLINSSGNVTIGSSDLAGTSAKLRVDGTICGGSLGTSAIYFNNGSKGLCVTGTGIAGWMAEFGNGENGVLIGCRGASQDVAAIGTIAAKPLSLNSDGGNVGIGTTNPSAQLHVSQDIVANGTIACKGVAAEGSAPVGTVDKWAGSIATGTKSQTYTHGLGTTDITVAIYEKNGNEWVQILTDVDIVSTNTIRVTFGANTTVEHRIVVMG
jgi:hypothetical protein